MKAAAELEIAVVENLRGGTTLTPDLGGSARTMEVAEAIQNKMLEK